MVLRAQKCPQIQFLSSSDSSAGFAKGFAGGFAGVRVTRRGSEVLPSTLHVGNRILKTAWKKISSPKGADLASSPWLQSKHSFTTFSRFRSISRS